MIIDIRNRDPKLMGERREMPVQGALAGHVLQSVTLDTSDVATLALMSADQLAMWVGHLNTRMAMGK